MPKDKHGRSLFPQPRVCTAELLLLNGKHVSIMLGVAHSSYQVQKLRYLFESYYGGRFNPCVPRYKNAQFQCDRLIPVR